VSTAEANAPHEDHCIKLDCAKSRSVLGWRPLWTLEETMAKIVAYAKAGDNREKAACVEGQVAEQVIRFSANNP
jgi:CDP-glucose 4,6-dehydratase